MEILMGENHKTYLYEISCMNQPTITSICKNQPIGDTNQIYYFVSTNLTCSCRNQPNGDTNPLYCFI